MPVPVLQHRNGTLLINSQVLQTEALQESYLAEPAEIGEEQLFVQSYEGFEDNQFLLIEGFDIESAEIVEVDGTPSFNSGIPLASALERSHPIGAKVYVIAYDQINLSRSATATGAKTNLTTTLGSGLISVVPDKSTQRYNETEYTSGFYFARFKNSITGLFSDYTDALEYGGWDKNTFGYILERSLRDNDEKLSEKITIEDCIEWGTEGLQDLEGTQMRWPDHYAFEQVLGQTTRGNNVVAMPTDAYDTESNRSLLSVRVGNGRALWYLDPIEFSAQQLGVCRTQVTTQATAGQTTLEIDNSYDFADSGSVNVYISGTKYSITYTGVTRSSSAGILTGVPASGTGSITTTIPVDTYVWQNEEEGIPRVYTVKNSNIEYYPLADATEDNKNIYSDYAKVATSIDSLGDAIDARRYDAIRHYLSWRVWAKAKNAGSLDTENGYYKQYLRALNNAIRTSPTTIRFKTIPKINKMLKKPVWKRPTEPRQYG